MDFTSTTGKVLECKAAVAWEKYKPLCIETVKVDPPKKGEVRLKMVAAGICHSDISHFKGEIDMTLFPVVLGHEGSGVVESVGPGVTKFRIGDIVIPLWKPECGDCDMCKHPGTNLCKKIYGLMKGWQEDGTTRFSKNGKPIYQLTGVGCFAEYCVMPAYSIVKVNQSAPMIKLPPFGCCFPTGYGAAIYSAGVTKGSTAVVFGLGAVGLCAVLGCRDAGATRIIGVDINPKKSAVGKTFGCTEFVNPLDHKEPIEEVLRKLTDDTLDFAIVAVGNKAVAESAVLATRPGCGKTVIVGLIHGKDQSVEVNHFEFIWGKTLTGTWCGGCNCLTDLPNFVDSYLAGKFNEVDLLTSQIIPLEQINEGMDALEEGKVLRSIIKF